MSNLAARYLALIQETNFGATGSGSYLYGEIDEESFAPEFELMDRVDVTRYGKRKVVRGTNRSGGEITAALSGDTFCGKLLYNVYGNVSKSGSGTAYTHTLTESQTLTAYKSFTVCAGRDKVEHRFLGQVVDELSLSANINEYVMISATLTGANEDATGTAGPGSKGFALAAPTASDLHPNDAYHFKNAKVNFSSSLSGSNFSELVKSVELSFSLGRDVDNSYALASETCTRAPPPTMREISGTIEFNRTIHGGDVANGELIYNDLLAGLLVNGTAASPALQLTFGSDTANEECTVSLFTVQYEAPETSMSGRDTQTMSLKFYALFDEGEGAMSSAVWKTTLSADLNA